MGLGSLKYVYDKESFILYSFLWKFLCGLGAGINSTATMAIVATHYKHERYEYSELFIYESIGRRHLDSWKLALELDCC
jgi:cell division protein FtsX